MRLTEHEKEILSKYLNDNLKYSETYAEFYDHIFTALEERVEGGSFKDNLEQIIQNDFGGFKGIRTIEIRYQRETTKEIKKRYFKYIIAYFKLPLVIVFIAGCLLNYLLTIQPWFSFNWFIVIVVLMAIFPSALNIARYFSAGYIWRRTKRSVKDRGFIMLKKYNPVINITAFLLFWHFFEMGGPDDLISNAPPIVRTLFLIVYALHTISFYKVYRDEFKVNMAQ